MHRGAEQVQDPAAWAQKMVYRMNYTMNFTQEQEAAVASILSSTLAQSVQARERMRELRQQLYTLHTDFDAQTAEQLTTEIGELTGSLALNRLNAQAEIYQLLSLEQRADMEQLLQKRRESGRFSRGEHMHL